MNNRTEVFLVILAISFFSFAFSCSAATIFEDNFDSYSIGNLNGQGGWSSAGFVYMVQTFKVKDGEKAIQGFNVSTQQIAQKSGSSVNDGKITVYVLRVDANQPGFLSFVLKEGANAKLEVRGNFGGNGRFQYVDGSAGSYVNFGERFNYETWYAIQIEWRSSDNTARYNINGGEWTSWTKGVAPWSLGLDTVELRTGNVIYWDNIQENLIGYEEKTPVLIIPGILGSAEKNGQWIIDPILHTYDNLIDAFKANGYEQGKTLFEFPYDWHQSNINTAIELKDKINEIKEICNCSKIDIVGHSMGGLIARQYIESDSYQNDVDKLIFLGTPHLGAPSSYLTWEGGIVSTDDSIKDKVLKIIFKNEAKENGYNTIFDYIRNKPIPSVQELLPIYNYLVDGNTLSVRHYPIGYPTNPFLENLNNNLSSLSNNNVSVYNIIGDSQNNSTINFIRVAPSTKLPLWEDGYPEGFDESVGDRGLALGEGDGTIPSQSSNIFPGTVSINSDHISLPTKAEPQIFNNLLGEGQYATIDNFRFTDLKLLIIKLLSPIDMQVIAPNGKKIGKDFSTNQEINEIPYAFYSGFQADDEYVTIINPEDGQYKIITQGTEEGGQYTVSSALVLSNQTLEQDFQGHAALGEIENLNLNLSSTENTIGITPEDIVPPQITIASPQNQDYLHSDSLGISYSVTDNDSGVFSSSAKLDTIEVDNGQNIDLFYQQLGSHNFTVEAEDNVSNKSNESVQFRVIATIDSTISDINRAYSLGWIAKESVRDELIDRLNKATKLITLIQDIEQKSADKPKVFKRIQKIEKKLDKVMAKLILIILKSFKKSEINQQAYDIISADINWLINN